MADNFDRILDECIDRINRGESLEACLADYPQYIEQLEPLLRAMVDTQMAYTFTPSTTAKRAARQRFNAALKELEQKREERQPLFPRLLGWSRVWATATAVILIALVGYFGLRPVLFPPGTVPQPSPVPVVPSPQPSTEGNFVFLISDEVNAIGDFESLNISISKVGLQIEGKDAEWLEFTPEVETVDLTLLQEDKAQEIWRGDIPQGQYTKVFIHVSNVSGVLKETGKVLDVKLPSEKLHIPKPFEVTSGEVTNFVYDITVIATGSPESGIKYIFKPQVGQSGADQAFNEFTPQGNTERNTERNKELNLEIAEEEIAPGDTVTLRVTSGDKDMAKATVKVNGTQLEELTGEDGAITFTIPEYADELEIVARKGKLEGELRIELA